MFRLLLAAAIGASIPLPGKAQQPGATTSRAEGALLENRLREQLDPWFARRRAALAGAATPAAALAHQRALRATLDRLVGPLPPRTPLRPRTVSRIDREGYRIEQVIFESQPHHHVTANLYLPAGPPRRRPGVLVPCGHSRNGKASPLYQSACAELARNGMVALCYDPIGQGERMQLLDAAGQPRTWGTSEHTLIGLGALLVGRHLAWYRIWDGIRALDYLCSRDEVDPERIGCTGNSGGGTLTSYLMALDERIAAAAPSCYLTSLERLFATIGPQDAEQNFPGQVRAGFDHADFVILRAPRPTLILVATRDFFDIRGSWDCFREAKRFYGLLGRGERVDLFEFDDEHGFSAPRRHAAVRFLWRWLRAGTGEPSFATPALCSDEELRCTATGQVLRDLPGSRSVVDLNLDRLAELGVAREQRPAVSPADLARLIACPPDHDGFPVPVIEGGPGALRARVAGREFAISVRGRGRTTPRGRSYGGFFGPDFRAAFLAMHGGDTLLGLRCADLQKALGTLAPAGGVTLVADASAQAVALHTAYLVPGVEAVVLTSPLRTYASLVADPVQPGRIGDVVPGALATYDLPDLVAALRRRGCTVQVPAR